MVQGDCIYQQHYIKPKYFRITDVQQIYYTVIIELKLDLKKKKANRIAVLVSIIAIRFLSPQNSSSLNWFTLCATLLQCTLF